MLLSILFKLYIKFAVSKAYNKLESSQIERAF